jgi:uncharacterized SAM-binding protein YcdF (DUF218 family)
VIFLKNLLLAFILPPINLAVFALAGLIVMQFRRRAGYAIALCALAGLLALSLPVVSGTLLLSLQGGLPTQPPADDPPKAIVVLGAEVARTIDRPTGAIVGQMTLDRLRAGAALYRRTGLPVLVTGGTVHPYTLPVSALMARSLVDDFQVPVRWSETASKDTWENARFSAAILKAAGIHSVYVVTHAWHMRRALLAFAAAGLTATAAPTSIDPPMNVVAEDFIPRASSWETAYFAFHEWVGLARYALR